MTIGSPPADSSGPIQEGANEARRKALAAYERVIAAGHGDPDMLRRVADIRAGRDTGRRAWMPDVD
jgi:hypothetical protein